MRRLRKRGNIWHLSLTWKGRRIQRSTGCQYREAAEKVLRLLENELAEADLYGRPPRIDRGVSLARACAEFKAFMDEYRKPSAWKNYPSRLRALQKALGPNRHLHTITEHTMGEFLKARQPTQSPSTHNSDLRTLGRFFGWCIEAPQRYLDANPLEHFQMVPVQRKEEIPLTVEEATRVLTESQGSPIHLPLALGLLAGLRLGECIALRWQDVDLEQGVYMLRSDEEWSPKNRRTQPNVMHGALVAILQRAQQVAVGELVCASTHGTPWSSSSLSWHSAKFLRGLGLASTHKTLRHTFVTWLAADPANAPAVVQGAARHRTIGTTFNVYAHIPSGPVGLAISRLPIKELPPPCGREAE